VEIRWITAVLDRSSAVLEQSAAFWLAATKSTLSPARGAEAEFASLIPETGDPCVRMQRVTNDPGGSHIDLHVDDIASASEAALACGATRNPGPSPNTVATLRSPGGLPLCLVSHRGEQTRPRPIAVGGTGEFLVDQICIDIPAGAFEIECRFWEHLTGWTCQQGPSVPEFARLAMPDTMPFRLLLQRRDESAGPTHCHLDIAANDRQAAATEMVRWGASRRRDSALWILMVDPAGFEFCLTGRDPHTGRPTLR
jgi:hypothetical protein